MAFGYTYDPQTSIIRIAGEGEVSMEERVNLVGGLLSNPQINDRAAVLIVVDRVTNAPTVEEMGVIGVLINRLQSRFQGRVAIVNVTVGHVTLSQFISALASGPFREVMVFSSEVVATEWLKAAL